LKHPERLSPEKDIRDLPIYATANPQIELTLGYHNIGSVINAATATVVRNKEETYTPRNGDYPLNVRLKGTDKRIPIPETGVFVPEITEPIADQFDYLSRLRGEHITLWTPSAVRRRPNVMIAPYINDPLTEAMITQDLGAEAFGLESTVAEILKNKKSFREIVEQLDMETLRVPDYRATTLDDIQASALDMLCFEEKLYDDLDMQDYTRGVMIQSVNSDGGFGSVMIKENKDKNQIQVVQDGELATVIKGTSREKWEDAFADAQNYLGSVVNGSKTDEVLVSRYVEHDDSPGGSVIIIDGQIADLGWNGQLINDGSNACVGTGTYTPKTEKASIMQDEYETQSVQDTKRILERAAEIAGIDFAMVNGFAGLDFMIPSAREQELQKRRYRSPKWNGPKPSAYAVECNARSTNWTDAVKMIMYMYGDDQTVNNMQKRIGEGIQTYDALPLREGVTGEEMRAALLEKYGDYKQTKSGLIVARMIPPIAAGETATIGVIVHKDVAEKRKEIDNIAQTIWEKKIA
jgi:hypothetical protein